MSRKELGKEKQKLDVKGESKIKDESKHNASDDNKQKKKGDDENHQKEVNGEKGKKKDEPDMTEEERSRVKKLQLADLQQKQVLLS